MTSALAYRLRRSKSGLLLVIGLALLEGEHIAGQTLAGERGVM